MNTKMNSDNESDLFLQQAGDLIRGMRAIRGMTRKMLAKDSKVSERYLANLEQGKGNISISLLRQVSRALNVSVAELIPSPMKQTPEQKLISEFVNGLTQRDQKIALDILHYKFSSVSPQNKTRIALIGLRGAGKTTLGSLLQERENIPFIRLAQEIENLGGMPIAEIFSLSGQQGYRRLEEKALTQTISIYDCCCIETGGSIVSQLKDFNLMLTTCMVIWIKTSPTEHMERVIAQGDMRPMTNNIDAMADLEQILIERAPFYEKAHAILDTSNKTVQESFSELLTLIKEHHKLKDSVIN
ncbi:MAG: transcriptional regulator [Gammaproteobacteria bacterium]|nr:MAG: transcriptional regulator [Gammaproteobacteria bacterium]PHR83577.1 MAG: transcriptional regulator [Colwellia sp.]